MGHNAKINLYSDTQSLPSRAMRTAMAEAEVGDEQHGADPTVIALCERVAALLGKEAAVFLPSGTMCNEIAIRVHCAAGDMVFADKTAHIIHSEGGAPAAISGVMVHPLDGIRGVFDAGDLERALPAKSRYAAPARLVSIEQTANFPGGVVWPLEAVAAVSDAAREADLRLHMDGARLLNAVVASGVDASAYAQHVDSVWIDLSKGLGCPVGAVLCGSRTFIDDVWRWKQRLGGAMRQAGIIAAAGLYALEHNIERLRDDHVNARRLATGVEAIEGLDVDASAIETNMVYFDVEPSTGLSAAELVAALGDHGVLVGAMGAQTVRAVTHLDISEADIDSAIAAIGQVVSAVRR